MIDSHHHLWNYAADQYGWIDDTMSVLRRDFTAAELRQLANSSGVGGFVTVQARQSLDETAWLLELARQEDRIRGVVGWVPLASDDVDQTLASLADDSWLKGIRHVVQDEPDDRFLLGERFNRGVARLRDTGLVYDLLIYARHLPAAIEFVDRHPEQSFVLDHIGKPTIRGAKVDPNWERPFRELARRERVSCKFSGVVTEVRDEAWDMQTMRAYWDVALEAFTPSRLMFGSDWPVCLLRADYGSWLGTVDTLASELSARERSDLFGGTATRVYRLG